MNLLLLDTSVRSGDRCRGVSRYTNVQAPSHIADTTRGDCVQLASNPKQATAVHVLRTPKPQPTHDTIAQSSRRVRSHIRTRLDPLTPHTKVLRYSDNPRLYTQS